MKYFNNPKANIRKQQIVNRRQADNIIDATYEAFMLLGIMALRDEFEWGSVRVERWIDKVLDLLDSYNKGYISVEDLRITIKDELGIEVNKK